MPGSEVLIRAAEFFAPFEDVARYAQGAGHVAFALTREGPMQILTAWSCKGWDSKEGPPGWLMENWARSGRPRPEIEPDLDFQPTVVDEQTLLQDSFMG